MQMIYCFINNVHVNYVALIWKGLHNSLMHPTAIIPYPRFTNIIKEQGRRWNEDSIMDAGGGDEAYHALPIHLVDEEIEQLMEGDDIVDDDEFMDKIFNSQEDPGTRLEPESHKERLEEKKSVDVLIINDDEEEESARDALIRKKGKGIMEIKDTSPPTPIRSPRTHTAPLSSNKEKVQELTTSNPTPSSSQPTTSLSKPKPCGVKQYKSIFHKMSWRYGYMFRHLKQLFMPRKDFKAITKGVHTTLKKVVPKMVDHNTNYFMKNNLPRVVAEAIKRERQHVKKEIATIIAEAMQKERENIRA
ncbi:hypothetical protein Tco_1333397 [Tanacetum coccineum]